MSRRLPLALIVATTMLLVLPILVHTGDLFAGEVPTSIFVIYAPNANLTMIAERLSSVNISSVHVIRAKPDLPSNPDYLVLWVLTGCMPGPDSTIFNVEERLVNRTIHIWRDAALVDVPFVDPSYHNYTINPMLSRHFIKPGLFTISINGSVYWNELGTNITTLFDGMRLEVKLDAYNITMLSLDVEKMRELGPKPIKVNMTDNHQLEYYVVFYLINISETEGVIRLFFPGALPTTGFLSWTIKPLESVNVHWSIPLFNYTGLLKELPVDAALWWISKAMVFTSNMVMRISFDVNTSVYHIYAPHLQLAKIAELPSELYERAQEEFVSVLASSVKQFMLTEDRRSVIVIFSPGGNEENVLIASNAEISTNDLLELTLSQYVGIVLSYSRASPLPNEVLLREASRVGDLTRELSDTRMRLATTELELNDTKRDLTQCKAELETASAKLLNIEEFRRDAQATYSTALAYLTTGLIATIVVSASLGYLAYVVAKKR